MRSGWRTGGTILAAAALVAVAALARAGEPAGTGGIAPSEQPNYLTSPFHGMRDGDGNIIPCRCRFRERDYRLGEMVCMQTHVGTVLTRCDLNLNNTSWIPTSTPCEVSALQPQSRVR